MIALKGRNSRLIPPDATINALKPALQAGKPVLLKHNEDECKAFKIKILYTDLFLIEAFFKGIQMEEQRLAEMQAVVPTREALSPLLIE